MAIVLTSFFALLATQAFTAPALIGLLDLRRMGAISDAEVVKLHLFLGLSIIAGALVLLWLSRRPSIKLATLVIATLLFAVVFSMASLVLDPSDFLAEESRMAGATGALLLLAALAARANAFISARDGIAVRTLWTGLALVFVLAALDELFWLHERVGFRLDRLATDSGLVPAVRSIDAQDAITLAYAVSAVAATIVLAVFLRSVARRRKVSFQGAFLAAAFVYLASVLLDNFHVSSPELLPTYDLLYAANAVEEVLELAAAGLLLSACVAALLEANDGALTASLRAAVPDHGPGASRTALGVAVVAIAACLVALIHIASILKTDAWATEPSFAKAVSQRVHPDLSPDGIATDGGVLYIANDKSSAVTAFRPGAHARVLADREHGLVRPESLGVGPDGTVYVTDDGVGAVFSIATNGEISMIGGPPGTFLEPKGIAFGPAGDLFLVDAGARKIYRLTPEGARVIADFADHGKPEEIAIDEGGAIFVTQEAPPRVYTVDEGGRIEMLADASTGLVAPESIAVWDGQVYVADSVLGSVVRLEQEGGVVPVVKLRINLRHTLEGLVIDECGDIFVGLRAGRRSAVLSVGRLVSGDGGSVLHAPGQDEGVDFEAMPDRESALRCRSAG